MASAILPGGRAVRGSRAEAEKEPKYVVQWSSLERGFSWFILNLKFNFGKVALPRVSAGNAEDLYTSAFLWECDPC